MRTELDAKVDSCLKSSFGRVRLIEATVNSAQKQLDTWVFRSMRWPSLPLDLIGLEDIMDRIVNHLDGSEPPFDLAKFISVCARFKRVKHGIKISTL